MNGSLVRIRTLLISSHQQETRSDNILALSVSVLDNDFSTQTSEGHTTTHTHTHTSPSVSIKKQDGGMKDVEVAWKIALKRISNPSPLR